MSSRSLRDDHVRGENDYYGRFPSGWQETAKHFRAAEVFDVASWEGVITALLIGCPTIVGRRGHAICYLDPRGTGSQVEYANSWGTSWKDKGFGIDSERDVASAIRSYGAFAIRTVEMDDRFIKLMRD